ncbi:MAG: hypothetical protein L0215_14250 [Gemmataceae bacterium]|nr:hypothetical protein [Gemmataceae bacterium]
MRPLRWVRRHPWLCLPVLTLIGVATAFYFFVLREGPVNAANFERIQEGMRPSDLTNLLGEPQLVVMHDDVRALAEEVRALDNVIRIRGPVVVNQSAGTEGTVYVSLHRDRLPSLTVAFRDLCKDSADRKLGRTQRWQEGDRAIVVVFDINDRAVTASFETTESTPSLWTRVKNWFQNLW